MIQRITNSEWKCLFSIFLSVLLFTIILVIYPTEHIQFTISIHLIVLASVSIISIIIFLVPRYMYYNFLLGLIIMITSISITLFFSIYFQEIYVILSNCFITILTFIPAGFSIKNIYYKYFRNPQILMPISNIIEILDVNDEYLEDCAICLEKLNTQTSILRLSCSHRYHKVCYINWNKFCPQCRQNPINIVEEKLNISE